MSTFETILRRRSIRKFTEEEISQEMVNKLLEAGMAGPSACNKQPWEFYVIRNKELQARMKKAARFTKMDSSLMIMVAGNRQNFLPKPIESFWMQDCGAAVENILLTATELGLGSCWCGLYPMKDSVKNVREILDLDESVIPMALIHLGHTDEEAAPRTQYDENRVHYYV